FRKVIQTALDRAFILATSALLTLLSALLTLLAVLLCTGLIAIERLLTLANAFRDSIARDRVGGFLQLPRGALLSLALTRPHCPCRLLQILLQTIYCVGERVFSFRQLLASLA